MQKRIEGLNGGTPTFTFQGTASMLSFSAGGTTAKRSADDTGKRRLPTSETEYPAFTYTLKIRRFGLCVSLSNEKGAKATRNESPVKPVFIS